MNNLTAPRDAVVAGHICLDIIPDISAMQLARPEEFYVPGKLIDTGSATIGTGGPVSNTGLAMRILGLDVSLMGKIGEDPFGELVRTVLQKRWGIRDGLIRDPAATTSYSIVLCPPGQDRMFLHCPGANDTFCADDIDYDLVARHRLFHFGYPPLMRRMYEDGGSELEAIFRRVHELGVTTSLDLALPDPQSPGGKAPWAAILQRIMPYVDICLPSAEEILYMLSPKLFFEITSRRRENGHFVESLTGEELHDVAETLLGWGGRVLGIKCGHRGLYVRSAGADRLGRMFGSAKDTWASWSHREFWQPTFRVEKVVSTTGSGDSTIAGFLSAYLRGLTLDEAARCACAVGACNVSAADSLGGLRSWEATLAAIAAGWETNPLAVTGQGWRAGGEGRGLGPADNS